jgi:hypothetical protein
MNTKNAFLAKLTWTDERAATGIYPEISVNTTVQAGGTVDVDTYNAVHAARVTIANTGAGITTVDLWAAYTTFAQNTKTNPTLLYGLLVKTSGVPATASCLIVQGATNPANLPLGVDAGTDLGTYTLKAGDWWAASFAGDDKVISNTAKNVDLSNPGSTAVVIDIYFIVGGGTDT